MTHGPYVHWSAAPLGPLTPCDPGMAMVMRQRLDKPHGLWFSAGDGDDGWRAWCESEGFGLERLCVTTEIVFRPQARVLRLGTAAEVRAFTQEYRRMGDGPTEMLRRYLSGPDWQRVGRVYDAIVIAPYVWECRMDDETFWYYSWDCASGCVWNTDMIETHPWTPDRPVDLRNAHPRAELVVVGGDT